MRPSHAALVLLSLGSFTTEALTAPLPWGPNGLPLATGPAKQRAPECWPDGQGGLLVSWAEPRDSQLHDIVVQRLTRAGRPAANWPAGGVRRTGVWGFDYPPSVPWRAVGAAIAPAGDGGFYLAWREPHQASGDDGDLFVARYGASGSIADGWTEQGIPLTVSPLYKSDPVLLPDGSGGLFAAWATRRTTYGSNEIRVDHVLPDGTRPSGWSVNGVRTTRAFLPSHQEFPVIIPDGAGGLLVGWRASGAEILPFGLNRILADGTPASDWPDAGVPLSNGLCQDLRLVPGPGGDAYAVWTETHQISPWIAWRIRATRISSHGNVLPGWPEGGLVVSSSSYGSYNTQAVTDEAGGLFVAWHNYLGEDRFDVRVQRLSPEGRFVFPADAIATSQGEGSVDYVQVIADGRGGTIATWAAREATIDQNHNDVFARQIDGMGQASYAPSPRGIAMSGAEGDQDALCAASDGAGGAFAVWVDLRTDPLGDIYAQWVPASFFPSPPPGPMRLELSHPYPNPASGPATVQLSLPVPERVEAALFDVQGQRLRTLVPRQVLSAGITPVVWDGRDDRGRLLPPGVYLLEVRTSEARAIRRIVRAP